jgi:hypothetical protein
MATDHILALLVVERDKLTAAIEALQGPAATAIVRDRRVATAAPAASGKRKLSAAGRRAIVAGTKKRWADIKAAKAAAAEAPAVAKKKTSPAQTAAFRKKMSERMKAAWAARKKKAAGKSKAA